MNIEATAKELLGKLRSSGKSNEGIQEFLDEEVVSSFSRSSSAKNNEGPEAQLEYLISDNGVNEVTAIVDEFISSTRGI